MAILSPLEEPASMHMSMVTMETRQTTFKQFNKPNGCENWNKRIKGEKTRINQIKYVNK